MKEIKLANNKGVALVDDEDFEMLNQYKWFNNGTGYAITKIKKNNKQVNKLMHLFIIDTPKDMQTDHIDRNKLNNQKFNLRIVTRSQNTMNRPKYKGTSKYKGVYYNKQNKNWVARIKLNKKQITIGSYEDEKDAALAYNEKAIELFKEYAYLNEV